MNVELIDVMGSDLSVVNAARVSFDKESDWNYGELCEQCNLYHEPTLKQEDHKLINYLAKHNHWTPFGHCFLTFRITAPIFVARQLGKHQVGLVWNEVSRRYVDSPPEFYKPNYWRARAENVKQGSSKEPVEEPQLLTDWQAWSNNPSEDVNWMGYNKLLSACEAYYEALLDAGVCPEQARMILPQSTYTEWIWSGSLAAFARVCKLRLDPHTQEETKQIAQMISEEVEEKFPISWKALMNV